jgi:hypothetical protein
VHVGNSRTTCHDRNNVSALKKKPAFEYVPADTLNIFNISYPMDDVLDATLQSFRPQHDPRKAVHHPPSHLKEVFPDPKDEHIHVVVERSSE